MNKKNINVINDFFFNFQYSTNKQKRFNMFQSFLFSKYYDQNEILVNGTLMEMKYDNDNISYFVIPLEIKYDNIKKNVELKCFITDDNDLLIDVFEKYSHIITSELLYGCSILETKKCFLNFPSLFKKFYNNDEQLKLLHSSWMLICNILRKELIVRKMKTFAIGRKSIILNSVFIGKQMSLQQLDFPVDILNIALKFIYNNTLKPFSIIDGIKMKYYDGIIRLHLLHLVLRTGTSIFSWVSIIINLVKYVVLTIRFMHYVTVGIHVRPVLYLMRLIIGPLLRVAKRVFKLRIVSNALGEKRMDRFLFYVNVLKIGNTLLLNGKLNKKGLKEIMNRFEFSL